MLTSYMPMVHLLKLKYQHLYITINYTPKVIWILPIFPLTSFPVPGFHLGTTLHLDVILWSTAVSQFFRIFHDIA